MQMSKYLFFISLFFFSLNNFNCSISFNDLFKKDSTAPSENSQSDSSDPNSSAPTKPSTPDSSTPGSGSSNPSTPSSGLATPSTPSTPPPNPSSPPSNPSTPSSSIPSTPSSPSTPDSPTPVSTNTPLDQDSFLQNCSIDINAVNRCADFDGNGLIEIYSIAEFNNIRYSLDGKSYSKDGLKYTSGGCPLSGCRGFELKNNLDFSGTAWASNCIQNCTSSGWEPLGTQDIPFSATLNGNGFAISNLFINTKNSNQGLIAFLSGEVQNLGIVGGSVISIDGDNVGSLVGVVLKSGKVEQVFANIEVSGSTNVGGLVGTLNGNIKNCYSIGNVSDLKVYSNGVGGLVGSITDGSIVNAYSYGEVITKSFLNKSIGGLIGFAKSNTGNIVTIEKVYALGSVSGSIFAGGLVGVSNINNVIYNGINYYIDKKGNNGVGTGNCVSCRWNSLVGIQLNTGIHDSWKNSGAWDVTVRNKWGFPALKDNTTLKRINGQGVSLINSSLNLETVLPILANTPTYFLNYNYNGGSGDFLGVAYLTFGAVVSLPLNAYKKNYTFMGWSTNLYGDLVRNNFVMPNTDVTLYAQWKDKEVTLSYEYNGGSYSGGDIPNAIFKSDLLKRSSSIVDLPTARDMNKNGYKFIGWSTSLISESFLYKNFIMPEEDVKLYARWCNLNLKSNDRCADIDGDGLIEISNVEELNSIRNNLNGTSLKINLSINNNQGCPTGICNGYELTNDLDFKDTRWYSGCVVNCETAGWSPIGSSTKRFSTTLNGNGFTISNLYINSNKSNSSFIAFAENATIINLGLNEVSIYSHYCDVTESNCLANAISVSSALVGELRGASLLEGIFVSGIVSGDSKVGGLVGLLKSGVIKNSYFSGKIFGLKSKNVKTQFLGGLVGSVNGGEIIDSYSLADVEGKNYSEFVGGVVGELANLKNNTINIENIFSVGELNASNDVGGLIGSLINLDNGITLTGYNYFTSQNIPNSVGSGICETCIWSSAIYIKYNNLSYQNWSSSNWDFESRNRWGFPALKSSNTGKRLFGQGISTPDVTGAFIPANNDITPDTTPPNSFTPVTNIHNTLTPNTTPPNSSTPVTNIHNTLTPDTTPPNSSTPVTNIHNTLTPNTTPPTSNAFPGIPIPTPPLIPIRDPAIPVNNVYTPAQDPGPPPSPSSPTYNKWVDDEIKFLKDDLLGGNITEENIKEKYPKFELNLDSLTFSRNDSTPYLFTSFKSSAPWKAIVTCDDDCSWITLSKYFGEGMTDSGGVDGVGGANGGIGNNLNNDNFFTITLKSNKGFLNRNATITFISGLGFKKLNIIQNRSTFNIANRQISAITLANVYTINFSGDANWRAVVSDPSWMRIVGEESGIMSSDNINNNFINLYLRQNTNVNPRTGILTFIYTDTGESVNVIINQNAESFELKSPENMKVLRTQAVYNIELSGYSTWWASSTVSWLSLSVSSGTVSGFSNLKMYVNQENLSDTNNLGKIVFNTNLKSKVLNVTQMSTHLNLLSESFIDTSSWSGTYNIVLSGDANWTAQTSANWISLSEYSGVVNSDEFLKNIKLYIEENNSSTRWASIIISYKGLADRIIYISQSENCVDCDSNGLIDIKSVDDLNKIRYATISGANVFFKESLIATGRTKGCPNNLCIGFELKKNLDFSGTAWASVKNISDSNSTNKGWEAIGTSSSPFRADFEGNGYTIKGLYINRPNENNQGLFGVIDGANIRNLIISNANITGGGNVGVVFGIAGKDEESIKRVNLLKTFGYLEERSYSLKNVKAINCNVHGIKNNIGGLAGTITQKDLRIHNSSFYGNVKGGSSQLEVYEMGIGGLVGSINFSNINNSHVWGNISGSDDDDFINVGGLVGKMKNSKVINSFVNGEVRKGYSVGGLVGNIVSETQRSSILNSYSNTQIDISNTAYVGGLVGSFDSDWTNQGVYKFNVYGTWIRDSYAITNFYGDGNIPFVGGLLGYFYSGTIKNSYSSSTVTNLSSYTIKYANLIGKVEDKVLADPLMWNSLESIRNTYYVINPDYNCKDDTIEKRADCKMPGAIAVNLRELVNLTTAKMTSNLSYTAVDKNLKYIVTYPETKIWQESSWRLYSGGGAGGEEKNVPQLKYAYCNASDTDFVLPLPDSINCGSSLLPLQISVISYSGSPTPTEDIDPNKPDFVLPNSFYTTLTPPQYLYTFYLKVFNNPIPFVSNEYRERILGNLDWNYVILSNTSPLFLVNKKGEYYKNKILQYQVRTCYGINVYDCSGWSPTYQVLLKP